MMRGLLEDIAIVPARNRMRVRDEQAAAEWLREHVGNGVGEAALKAFAEAEPDPGETELEAAIRTIAAKLASGRLVAVRLTEPAPVLDPPEIVDLADLVQDEPTADRPAPTASTTWFESRIVDGFGRPLEGVEVRVLHDEAEARLSTDTQGRVRLDGVRSTGAKVWVPCTDALRKGLEAAWAQPSTESFIEPSEEVEVAYFRDEMVGPLTLRPEAPKTLSIRPFVVLGRMTGMAFDTDRTFLLPISLDAIAELKALFDRCVPCRLLVVGHTDTKGDPAYNERLSLERARVTLEYLTDDVEAWLARYGDDVEAKQRWGAVEDMMMLEALPDYVEREPGADPVRWFQSTRGLVVDGDLGPNTRRALVTEYMARDGTTLPAEVQAQVHGCGEAFPLDATGEALAEAPLDGLNDPIDRRVELFFFGDSLGVLPAPAGEISKTGSTEYLSWRRRTKETHEKVIGAQTLEIELLDMHGRPVPHAEYVVRLPARVTIEGQLDDHGQARVDRLPPGSAQVDFPQLQQGFTVVETSALKGGG